MVYLITTAFLSFLCFFLGVIVIVITSKRATIHSRREGWKSLGKQLLTCLVSLAIIIS
jgi:4-amino-4-deoxy-L-arabinose transferase-like glycosyltransferase